ncbi:TetR/AcrR family transcriptional regulator [Bacillus sp. 1P06AnD]|uniref:TetR/AcrR family transcriptional regulator n=1 Tax=Bacillus sp. 1P06AnD TaxID=3132208 RepID=UPI0039A2B2E0
MKNKEKLIMDVAMKLFSKKGFSSTSIQEIATEAEISKGSFYLYYKSKENLLYRIFLHHYETFHEEVTSLEKLDLTPRELFVEQMVTQYKSFLDSKEFLIMFTRESAIPFNKEIGELIGKIRAEVLYTLQKTLSDVYGSKLDSNIWSMTLLVQGLAQSYLELVMRDIVELDLYNLAQFILKRCDSLAEGFDQDHELISIKESDIQHLFQCPFPNLAVQLEDIQQLVSQSKSQHKENDNAFVTLDVLEEELRRPLPRIPVIQGMVANLQKDNMLQDLQSMLKQFFHL